MSLYLQMDSSIPFLTSIPTITFFFFFLITLPPQSHCCTPYNCGNLRNISFPFFGENQPYSCGIADFQLRCVDNQTTILIRVHPYMKFRVLEINQMEYRIRMVPEFVDNSDVCSSEYTNVSLSPNLFKYPQNGHNVSIFYNCSPGVSIRGNDFWCGHRRGFYVDENILRGYPQLQDCGCHIQVPAMRPIHLQPAGGIDALHEALDDGFDVHYNITDCNESWRSGGLCGTWKDAPSNSCSSPQPSSSNDSASYWSRKVIIGDKYKGNSIHWDTIYLLKWQHPFINY